MRTATALVAVGIMAGSASAAMDLKSFPKSPVGARRSTLTPYQADTLASHQPTSS
jgi:hypothetical protein